MTIKENSDPFKSQMVLRRLQRKAQNEALQIADNPIIHQ
jgi:hypothetical protein